MQVSQWYTLSGGVLLLVSLLCCSVLGEEAAGAAAEDVIATEGEAELSPFEMKMSRLVEWWDANDVVFKEDIALKDPNGVITFSAIPGRTLHHIVEIPESLAMSDQSAHESEIAHIFFAHPEIFETSVTHTLLLHILHELRKGDDSAWGPYLDALPEKLDNPFYWTEEQKKMARGSWVLDRMESDLEGIKESYQEVFEDVLFKKHPDLFPRDFYTLERWVWAWTTVWSKAFYFDKLGMVMVPMLDSFNHMNGAESEIDLSDGMFKLGTRDAYKENSEIYINRGDRPNNDLLRLYGYITKHNRQRTAFLNATIPPDDPHIQIKEALLSKHSLLSPPYPYGDTANGLFVMKEVPSHVLGYFRVRVWEPTSNQIKKFESLGQLPDWNPRKQLNDINEKDAVKLLVQVLEEHIDQYPEGYKDDEKLLEKEGSLGRIERMIVRVRLEEKKTLNEARQTIIRKTSMVDDTIL